MARAFSDAVDVRLDAQRKALLEEGAAIWRCRGSLTALPYGERGWSPQSIPCPLSILFLTESMPIPQHPHDVQATSPWADRSVSGPVAAF